MPLPVTKHGTAPLGRFVNPRHERLTLPLGPVDRESGVFNSPRGATRDLRNVLLRGGTLHMRRGMDGISGTFTGAGGAVATDVLGIEYLAISNTAVVVTYSRITGEVAVFLVNGDGTGTPEYLGTWWHFDWDGSTLPVVSMAESGNKVFMAHDEPVVENRAPTFAYSPQGGIVITGSYGETFGPLRAYWDTGSTDDQIYFRGVVAYLDYLVGWGWGDNDTSRPEIVRISLPGEPIIGGPTNKGYAGFEPGHWVIAGSRGSPVISCVPAGNGLLLLKPDSAYPLVGTSPASFGVGPAVDQNFGIIGPNLWVNINNRAYIWTHEGPKVSSGGPLEDMALPLDLDGPAPDGDDHSHIHSGGFGVYIPKSRVALFVFDHWVYALDVDAGSGGWSYWALGVSLRSAKVLYQGAVSSLRDPIAGPTVIAVTGETDTTITVDLDITGHEGGEKIQVWARDLSGNEWVQHTYDEITLADPGDPAPTEATIEVTELEFATAYELAFRYDIQGVVHENYEGSPDTWPAASRVAASTSGMDMLAWSRTSDTREILTVTFVEYEVTGSVLEKSTDDGQTWTEVATEIATGYEYEAQAGEGETEMRLRVSYPTTAHPVQEGKAWVGPLAPRNPVQPTEARFQEYDIAWEVGHAGSVTVVSDNSTAAQPRRTTAVDETAQFNISIPYETEQAYNWELRNFGVSLRHELTQFGVMDYSQDATAVAEVQVFVEDEGGGPL